MDVGSRQAALESGSLEVDLRDGWRMALLVARNVEPEPGPGQRGAGRRISAREFARRAGTSHKRVMAYLRAWECAAEDGLVPHAGQLATGVDVRLPDGSQIPFFGPDGYYRCYDSSCPTPLSAHGRQSGAL